MKTLTMVLKSNHSTNARSLRPLLLPYVNKEQDITSTFIRNFRQRVAYFLALNPNFSDLSIDEVNLLVSQKYMTEEEHKVLDNPLIRIKFNDMLRKIMSEDSSTWEALAFAKRCKKEMPGFDFKVRLDKDNHPDAIVYRIPMMRSNLLRYGYILFLDAQKRQHNEYNWPYIAPCIKDHENSIGLICESIVISEDLDTYAWILRQAAAMEPRWSLTDIRLIFADQLITNNLLVKLGIEKACTLRGDVYHLMNEVWPKTKTFGQAWHNVLPGSG